MRKKLSISLMISGLLLLFAMNISAEERSDTWLGVYTQTIDEDLKEAFSLDYDRGAIIKQVVPDSPADKAGLEQGDIIIKLGDKELIDADDLSATVSAMNPGEKVDILIIRDGKEETISATLGSSDKDNYEPGSVFKWYGNSNRGGPHSKYKSYSFMESDFNNTYIGINLDNLNDQLGEYFGVKEGKGILITEVFEDSPAKKAGLKAGDVIIEVDGEQIGDISDVQKTVRQKEAGEKVELTLLRDKKKKEFSVEVAEAPESYGMQFKHQFDPNDFHNFIPNMKGMFFGDLDGKSDFSDKNGEAIKRMQQELDALKKELKEIREKIN